MLRLMDALGRLHWLQREYDEAKEIFQGFVEINERKHGKISQQALHARSQLAAQYRDNGDPEAYDMLKECLDVSRKVHGDDHEQTLYRLGELAIVLKARAEKSKLDEDYQAAESELRDAIAAHEGVLGSGNEGTLGLMHALGHLHWLQGEYEEAKEIYVRYVEINEQEHGEISKQALHARSQLTAQYWGSDDPAAYDMATRCLEISRKVEGEATTTRRHPSSLGGWPRSVCDSRNLTTRKNTSRS
jgi:tetratricopeptide (TPR) repeat protein